MSYEPSEAARERFARQQERLHAELLGSGLPVFALAGPALPGAARFAGLGQADGRITSVRVVHGEGLTLPWAAVETVCRSGTSFDSGPLRGEVEVGMRGHGHRFADVEWTEGDTTVLVDGVAVAGRLVRAGDRWWAARCSRQDVEITVVARDWRPEVLSVHAVTELTAMLARPHVGPPGSGTGPDDPEAARVPAGEPHRVLADVCLRLGRERAALLADGGPGPRLPGYWRTLWRAAVRRQMELADQPEPVADRAVSGMLAQLSTLQDGADWFRADARLRERAVAETLLFATSLSEAVSSAGAQRAWQRREETVRRPDLPVQIRAAADEDWRDAWSAWANGHAADPAR
ncbi:hypothetical protein [Catellatospora chokoriensis]|uniref:Uncharacterized protein n=1 Tax=Catellatospora chokoriensis TaxID=310353 RepID=A0A8J3JUB4_9ACTN|nr:hypothetical protein [Catellatospora chokoriensis]GIF91217.1 hypothetical protein Cch02nite_46610 [Catellatospora chokoriensis]